MNNDLSKYLHLQETAERGVSEAAKEHIRFISEQCPASICNTQHVRHMNGEKLSRTEAMLAKCADCMGNFEDGRNDCKVFSCPMYAFMPYRSENSEE
jgi:hypothetical protein